MKLIRTFLILFVMLAVVCPLFAQGNGETSSDPIVIGVIAARTGDNAGLGEMQGNGAQLAANEINAKGGVLGRQIKLIFEDSQGVPAQATAALNKLIYRDNAIAIVGDCQSSPCLAMMPVVEEAKIPMLAHGTALSICEQGNQWVFRTRANDPVKFGSLAAFLEKEGYKRIAVLHDNVDYGLGGMQAIASTLEGKDFIVAEESFTPGDKDYSSQIIKLKNANPDVLVVIGPMADMGLAMKQCRQMGLECQFAGGAGIEGSTTLDAAGGAGEGLIFAAGFIAASPDPQVSSFVKSFEKLSGGKTPDDFAATGYDSIYILAAAIEHAGSSDPVAIQKALHEISVTGVEGVFQFDEKGEGLHSMQYGTIKNGTVAYYEN